MSLSTQDTSLHDQLASLERRKAELVQGIAGQTKKNQRLDRILSDLAKGVFAGSSRRSMLLAIFGILLLLAGVLLYARLTSDGAGPVLLVNPLSRMVVPRLLITSDPSGAAVTLDQGATRHKQLITPVHIPAPRNNGTVKVTLTRNEYKPQRRELQVSARGGAHWHARLQPEFWTMTIETDPPGARVWMAGTPRGMTPMKLKVKARPFGFELRKRGYKTQKIQYDSGPRTLRVKLPRKR